ncbi:Uncharacterised protein [Mycoplasmopsis maculosa]|uniref:Immunoglobulin-blocking virulence protein n=1 Tax=Mycoplasmopsis maculosa TaxID=114885 RepID=A0A449B3Q3_9BACT|nr:putative immunoglobulin-blocking virulence protein [Mycoplasmopsis maculosa]VEU75234.1 Uncharacterised protein [Mycoplasmopsis maculosa]
MKNSRKAIFYSSIVLGTIATSSTAGSLFYFKITDSSSSLRINSNSSKPNVAAGDDFNTANNFASNKDGLLIKEKTPDKPKVDFVPPTITPPKKEEPKVINPPIEEKPPVVVQPSNPVEEKPEPEPIAPKKPKDETIIIENPDLPPVTQPKKDDKKLTKIKKDEIEYFAEIIEIPPRAEDQSDIDKGLTNRVPYRAEITPDVGTISNGASEANIKASIARAQKNAKSGDWVFSSSSSYREILENENRSIEIKQNYFNNIGSAPEQLGNLYSKYFRLLKDKETIGKYVDDIGLKNLDKWWNSTEYISWQNGWNVTRIPLGHLLLLIHIDHSKITKLSKQIIDALNRGEVIPKDGGTMSVNENGEWVAHNFEPAVNKVTGEMTRNNKHKRVLGNNEYWWRTPNQIEKGKYANWSDKDITNEFRNKGYDVPKGGGIVITKYTRNEEIENESRTEAIVVTIDVLQDHAYNYAKTFIEKTIANGDEITGYRIRNIGKKGANQSLFDIMKALPKKLPLLELFFESKNTADLIAIKDKEIDELALITNNRVNSLADDWAFNPWALQNVAWVNTADYNVSSSYSPNDTIYTRITFDNLAFDPEDYKTPGDFSKINDGLRMAYWVRNNERIFQGPFGPGLKPDRDLSGNSYPMGIDLSRIKNIKSLMGLVFYDNKNPSNIRKLNKIKLYNNSNTFEISTFEMNKAQFNEILIKQSSFPRSKIMFSNGTITSKIKIVPTQGNTILDSSGLANLSTLMQYSDGNFSKSNTEIIIPKGANSLESQLRNAGYRVRFHSKYDGLNIN